MKAGVRTAPYFRHVTLVPATVGPFSQSPGWRILGSMSAEPKNGKDSMKVEKLSLLILTLCIVVLVYVLVRPF